MSSSMGLGVSREVVEGLVDLIENGLLSSSELCSKANAVQRTQLKNEQNRIVGQAVRRRCRDCHRTAKLECRLSTGYGNDQDCWKETTIAVILKNHDRPTAGLLMSVCARQVSPKDVTHGHCVPAFRGLRSS